MGVTQLWKSLEKGGCVEHFNGAVQEEHAAIVKEVEHKVIAVDLSLWLMQAQMQPALAENFLSPQACAVKVVFDRTCHWLRHGCLPVFVYEGQPPADKLKRLQNRCIATGGHAGHANTNRVPFMALRPAVLELLTAMGVPSYQAAGEGEATCAALNALGWVHGCQTLDVDAMLFGAQTVYRNLALHTDDPKKTMMTRCTAEGVQRMLGISQGGQRALVAVAQLAGGDYDVQGAERVGEVLAVHAVRTLLKGAQSDQSIIEELANALARGPDPTLDALTKCTGCKSCGHNSNNKTGCKQHGRGGCQACGTSQGCTARDFEECECPFHQTKDERMLNRVVRRASQTPGFNDATRSAVSTYAQETQRAVLAVQRDYGIAGAGSVNPFSWSRRPDARAVSALLCRYIPDLDYNQVRLKLLPVLLEWDMRQGPHAALGSVELRPTSIRKVSEIGRKPSAAQAAADNLSPEPWRYVMVVERITSVSQQRSAAQQAQLQEDLAIDEAWISNSARSRPKADKGPDQVGEGVLGDAQEQSQGMGVTPRKPGKAGTLNFSEKRSVRCSLVAHMWPHLVQEFEDRRTGVRKQSGGAGSKGGKKKSGGVAQPADGRQLITNYFTQSKANAAMPTKANAPMRSDGGQGAGPSSLQGKEQPGVVAENTTTPSKARAGSGARGEATPTGGMTRPAAAAKPSTSGRHASCEDQQLDRWLAQQLAGQREGGSVPAAKAATQPRSAAPAGANTSTSGQTLRGHGRGRGSKGSGGVAAGSLDRFLQGVARLGNQQPATATAFVGQLNAATASASASAEACAGQPANEAAGSPTSAPLWERLRRLQDSGSNTPLPSTRQAGICRQHADRDEASSGDELASPAKKPCTPHKHRARQLSPAVQAQRHQPMERLQHDGQEPRQQHGSPPRPSSPASSDQPAWMDTQYASMLRAAGISPCTQPLQPDAQQQTAPGPFAQRRALFAGAAADAQKEGKAPFRSQLGSARAMAAVVDLSVSPVSAQTLLPSARQPAVGTTSEVVDLT